MRHTIKLLLAVLVLGCLSPLVAEVRPNPLFSDHAILQRDMEVPVWGSARDGESVTVEFAGQKASATAAKGKWMVRLKAMPASATPRTMTISGDNKVEIHDLLVGEVWIASGQSNMERMLGPTPGQKPIDHWQEEAAGANFPVIRQFHVRNRVASEPVTEAEGSWLICSPETAAGFSAVGFFFARKVHQDLGIPVGLLFTSWGGTEVEAWTSGDSLVAIPGLQVSIDLVKLAAKNPAEALERYATAAADWYHNYDEGSRGETWAVAPGESGAWKSMTLPALWEEAGLPGFDGVVWFRKEVELPEGWAGKDVTLHLGPIDDNDTTFVNGMKVGATESWDAPRDYRVPAGVWKAGRNVIAVRVLDTGGSGGLYGKPGDLRLEGPSDAGFQAISLSGDWQYRVGGALEVAPAYPSNPSPDNPHQPTVLFNGMIAPLVPYAIRGATWYQGEANSGHGRQYRTLFPLFIADWRKQWGEGDFPFLFVQIAPHIDMTPEIREAQMLTLARSPRTAMAVTTDAGDAKDIHPSHKRPVGERLALGAEAVAYGRKVEYSGPLFRGAKFKSGRAIVEFTHADSGLVAKDGPLKGFTIAGADKKFIPATASIEGKKVVVRSDQVSEPVAVRYGWANVPDVNLFNGAGLPASPFRSDVD